MVLLLVFSYIGIQFKDILKETPLSYENGEYQTKLTQKTKLICNISIKFYAMFYL